MEAAMDGAVAAAATEILHGGGDSRAEEDGDDLGPMIGPGPARPTRSKRPLEFEQAFLDALPSAAMSVASSPLKKILFLNSFFLLHV
jgi:hypothetical protein